MFSGHDCDPAWRHQTACRWAPCHEYHTRKASHAGSHTRQHFGKGLFSKGGDLVCVSWRLYSTSALDWWGILFKKGPLAGDCGPALKVTGLFHFNWLSWSTSMQCTISLSTASFSNG
ncbi:hypothetical protein Salat_0277400 [Sesamum alatum]|uniref:Uncharacterized protein n=1 Tax=Sesamum alatum TaxID=300844 RepID=A0AAE1YZ70_9LAMI|nr:hypothetical protein Salat_0277400 [Sesamum alatum]